MIRLQAEFWKLWFCLRQKRRYHFVGIEPVSEAEVAHQAKVYSRSR